MYSVTLCVQCQNKDGEGMCVTVKVEFVDEDHYTTCEDDAFDELTDPIDEYIEKCTEYKGYKVDECIEPESFTVEGGVNITSTVGDDGYIYSVVE